MTKPVTPEEIQESLKPWMDIARQQEVARERETQRREQLTPAARQAEDLDRARIRQVEETREFQSRIGKAALQYRGHESLTLREFGSLLHGIDVTESLGFAFFRRADADATIAQLESSSGASIHAVNLGAPASQRRFKTVDLLAWARSKRFRGADVLSRALGFELPIQTNPLVATHNLPNAEPKADKRQQPRERRDLVRKVIEILIPMYERISGKTIDRKAPLPLTHDIIFECFVKECGKRGLPLVSTSSVRAAMPVDCRLMDGNPDEDRIEHLSQLRKEIKTIA